ncbi:galactokinase [Mucilaginibacter koreensis]
MNTDQLKQNFEDIYQHAAAHIYFSPGRVNLIGEHIDYNGGLVMPCAITFGTWLLIAPNQDQVLRFRSVNFDEQGEVKVQSSYQKQQKSWYNYPLGVLQHFAEDGHTLTTGFDFLYFGNLPVGSGLSSSASIEIVTAFALNEILNAGYKKVELVKLAKWVENKFIGLNSGIMDQFAVAFGSEGKAIELDCETLDYHLVDVDLGEYLLAIINTNKPRKLAESKYNERVAECAQALAALQQELPIKNLCDINADTFRQHAHLITDATVAKRAQHVVEENDRVKQAAQLLNSGDLTGFGQLMYASHHSLRDLYEVSGIELDTIEAFSETFDGVIGARMTGAGFGGCAIALVKRDAFEDYSSKLTEHYTQKIGYAPTVYSSVIADGVHEVKAN